MKLKLFDAPTCQQGNKQPRQDAKYIKLYVKFNVCQQTSKTTKSQIDYLWSLSTVHRSLCWTFVNKNIKKTQN